MPDPAIRSRDGRECSRRARAAVTGLAIAYRARYVPPQVVVDSGIVEVLSASVTAKVK